MLWAAAFVRLGLGMSYRMLQVTDLSRDRGFMMPQKSHQQALRQASFQLPGQVKLLLPQQRDHVILRKGEAVRKQQRLSEGRRVVTLSTVSLE